MIKDARIEHEKKYDATSYTIGRGVAMQLYSGKPFYPEDPRVEDIDIQDIAQALSMTTRYGGHVTDFYSVAEHSVHMSNIVSEENAFIALMHDATEAYIGDLVRPIKYLFPEFQRLEDNIWFIIATKYGLPIELPDEVKNHDVKICFTERSQILNYTGETDWGYEMESHDISIMNWTPEQAKAMFLNRFYDLYEADK